MLRPEDRVDDGLLVVLTAEVNAMSLKCTLIKVGRRRGGEAELSECKRDD